MPSYDADQTVAEILKLKSSGIRSAPLPAGVPAWSQLLGWTWTQVEAAAVRGQPGLWSIRKLRSDSKFNRGTRRPPRCYRRSCASWIAWMVTELPYRLEHARNSLMISLATPRERLKIKFFDGRIEVEQFRGTGEIEGEETLEAIFPAKCSHA